MPKRRQEYLDKLIVTCDGAQQQGMIVNEGHDTYLRGALIPRSLPQTPWGLGARAQAPVVKGKGKIEDVTWRYG